MSYSKLINSFLIDKLIILILCIITAFSTLDGLLNFAVMLCSFILSCIISYFDNDKLSFLIFIAVIIASFFFFPFIFFIPLIIYDIVKSSYKWFSFLSLIPLINNFYNDINSISKPTLLFILFWVILSFILSCKSFSYQILKSKYTTYRDDSVEYNLKLSKKNHDLLEKQDYEISYAMLNERNRIAREIHDNVGHMLSRSLLQVGALIAINKEPVVEEHLISLKDSLNDAMNSIRASVHDLHNDSIDVETNINNMLKDYTSYDITFEYDTINNIPKNIKYCLISIVKEALSNVVRHSNADKIKIIIVEHPSFYQLLFEDNGSDININNDGIGLENIRERIRAFDGIFNINTSDGFKIFVSIPIKSNSDLK